MEVRKDFGKRAKALVAEIPPAAISMLLKAILPKTVPISTRAPAPRGYTWMDTKGAVQLPEPHAKAPGKRKGRPMKPDHFPRWNILVINAHANHNESTTRHWMAKAATWCATPPLAPRNLIGAERMLNDWGKPGIVLDIAWLVRKGYIELVEGED